MRFKQDVVFQYFFFQFWLIDTTPWRWQLPSIQAAIPIAVAKRPWLESRRKHAPRQLNKGLPVGAFHLFPGRLFAVLRPVIASPPSIVA
ncbi:MAG: hypothetical protein OXF88_07250 [Rhodobacteraceae bacterium]|nr:hypothetical protein [Paracoccaceae bacterium]MCY4140280.1 hypothetical protein [Paracoccaceae bacterium]